MKKYFIHIILMSLFLPALASAATFNVLVDSGNATINALEATMHLPKPAKDFHTGGSAILFWIKSPTLDEGTLSVNFSGLTPGGFESKREVFSFSGDFTPADISRIKFTDITALKNDGKGTPSPVSFSVVKGEELNDSIPPETFQPTFAKQEDLFGGSYFLSFVAQDKGTGVDHYEYAATHFLNPGNSDWKMAESPLVITSGETYMRIFIKAVDKSGNERVVPLFGPHYYRLFFLWAIIIVLFIWALSYIKRFVR